MRGPNFGIKMEWKVPAISRTKFWRFGSFGICILEEGDVLLLSTPWIYPKIYVFVP
jgi:hypothetical protein